MKKLEIKWYKTKDLVLDEIFFSYPFGEQKREEEERRREEVEEEEERKPRKVWKLGICMEMYGFL